MNISKLFYLLFVASLLLTTTPSVQSKPLEKEKEQVMRTVKEVVDKFIKISTNKRNSFKIKRKQIKKLYYDHVDIKKFARNTLRRGWKKISPEQQSEYAKKFNRFVLAFYLSRLEKYENNKIVYEGVKIKSNAKAALVKTTVDYRGQPFSLNYYMSKKKSRWYIYDFSIEGVRISSTYYSQLKNVLSKGGYESLNKELDKLLKAYQ